MSPLILSLSIAALYGLAAYALRPPQFIPWPGYRWTGQDVSRFRVMVAGWVASNARNQLADEQAKVALLKRRLQERDARIGKLIEQRDAADARAAAPAAAPMLLDAGDGVALRIEVIRPASDEEDGSRGAASAAIPTMGRR